MKVSIITTCYNRVSTIRESIESVLGQDYPNIEYIVVDGASKDGSMAIVNEYKDRIATIISEPDSGLYEAINKGIRIATGDIVGLMHSDDLFYSKSTISHIVEHFEKNDIDIMYGDGLFVDAQNISRVVRNWISGEYKKGAVANGWLPIHPSLYIRKECFDVMGLYDESYRISSDTDFMIRYLYKGNFKIKYLNEYIVKMRMGGVSTDVSQMKNKWSEDLRIYKANGLNQYWALSLKILSKIPQFITAKFVKA